MLLIFCVRYRFRVWVFDCAKSGLASGEILVVLWPDNQNISHDGLRITLFFHLGMPD
jgi:hypothetical protein